MTQKKILTNLNIGEWQKETKERGRLSEQFYFY